MRAVHRCTLYTFTDSWTVECSTDFIDLVRKAFPVGLRVVIWSHILASTSCTHPEESASEKAKSSAQICTMCL